MNHTQRLFFSLLFVGAVAACADPVGDAPRAQTVSSSTPAAAPPPADAPLYTFSQDGSRIDFVGAKVTNKHDGGFRAFKGTITGTAQQPRVDVEIDMASVWSDAEKLTGHLKSPDFFDVAKFPTARFTSTSIAWNADGTSTVTGDLTLHGVTKRIAFPATITASGETATARAAFGIDRKDFAIVYPGMPDDLIKDEVLLKLDVKAQKAGPRS